MQKLYKVIEKAHTKIIWMCFFNGGKMLDEIKIGWKNYKIIKTNPNHNLIDSGKDCYGEIDYNKREIYLNESLNDEEQNKATLIHEMLHGISEMYNLELSEDIVSRLGEALYIVIKDNGIKLTKENRELIV